MGPEVEVRIRSLSCHRSVEAALPLGPPTLMMSTTEQYPGPGIGSEEIRKRDEQFGIDTESKKRHRQTFLDPDYQIAEGADQYDKTGEVPTFEGRVVPFKTADGEMSK